MRIATTLKAIGALAVLVALAGGPPVLLVRFIGNPWPAEGIDLGAPLTDGALFGLLAVIIWVAWAQMMLSILAELVYAARALGSSRSGQEPGDWQASAGSAGSLPGVFGFQQQLARRLVMAVLAAVVLTPAIAGTAHAATGTDAGATAGGTSPAPAAAVAHQNTDQDADADATAVQTPSDSTATEASPLASRGVVVEPYESLWSIAERELGSGERWAEIASLNEGQAMVDGTVFDSNGVIRPGWTLQVPDDSPAGGAATPEAAAADGQYVVEKGDTLSQIAAEHLGDPDAYPALFEATTGVQQPDGRYLSDPNVIDPGWVIQIPSHAAHAAPEAAPEPAPGGGGVPQLLPESNGEDEPEAPADDQVESEPSTSAGGSADQTETGGAAADAADEGADNVADSAEEAGWPTRTAGGIAALLAASVVALIGLRRRRQQRDRRPGEQIAMPYGDAAAVEQEVRAVADEASLASVQVATAGLVDVDGAAPAVRAVRTAGEWIELYLEEPAALPAPWEPLVDPEASETTGAAAIWRSTAAAVTASAAGTTAGEQRYPALVALGADDEEGQVLLNLEQAGGLSIEAATEDLAREVLTAIALELAVSPWGASADVCIVGDRSELVDAVEPGRLRYVPTIGDYLQQADVDVTARVLVVLGAVSEGDLARLTATAAPVTTVAAGDVGRWTLRVETEERAWLAPTGVADPAAAVAIAPQRVDERSYRGLVATLNIAGQRPGEVVPFDGTPDALLAELEAEAALDVTAGHGAPVDEQPVDEQPVDEQPVDEQPADDGTSLSIPTVDDENDGTDEVHPLLRTGAPVVRILGPVAELLGVDDDTAPANASHRRLCVRMAAFMAMNPTTSRQALTEALWPGQRVAANTVTPRISNLRKWLGEDEHGEPYLPPRSVSLRSVTTDYAIFRELVGSNPSSAATTALETALQLVRGRVLEGEESRSWGWAEYEVQSIVSLIVDTTYELARRRYMETRWADAAQAAALGVWIDPGNERLWRLRIHAAHSAGNHAQVEEAISRMHERITELGFDLEEETVELVSAIREHDRTGIEQSRQAL